MRGTIELLAIVCAIFLLAAIGLWVAGNSAAALGLVGLLVGLVLLLAFAAIWALGGWWMREAMKSGAEIALRAQEQDDRWDMVQTRATTDVFKAGVAVAREVRGPGADGTPPLPSQGFNLPELPKYAIGAPDPDVWDIGDIAGDMDNAAP
jgi:hypothetical protein